MSTAEGMDSARIAEIQARSDRASPAPWTSFWEGRDHTSGSSFIMTGEDDIDPVGMSVDDQDFAAYARQAVPQLLQELRRRLDAGAAARVLTLNDLVEIERRCEAASPAPWTKFPRSSPDARPESTVTTGGDTGSFELRGGTEHDHDFIAHARQDLPWLVAKCADFNDFRR
jgi:hypothetical protein